MPFTTRSHEAAAPVQEDPQHPELLRALRQGQELLDAPAVVVEMDASQEDHPLTFSEHFPRVCICRWVSYLGITGWFFAEGHPRCQIHGKKEET